MYNQCQNCGSSDHLAFDGCYKCGERFKKRPKKEVKFDALAHYKSMKTFDEVLKEPSYDRSWSDAGKFVAEMPNMGEEFHRELRRSHDDMVDSMRYSSQGMLGRQSSPEDMRREEFHRRFRGHSGLREIEHLERQLFNCNPHSREYEGRRREIEWKKDQMMQEDRMRSRVMSQPIRAPMSTW